MLRATAIAIRIMLKARYLEKEMVEKHELFMESIRHYAETRMALLADVLNAPGSPLENVRNVVRLWGDPPPEFAKGCLFCNSLAEFGQEDSEVADFLRAQLGRATGLFADTLERAVTENELPTDTDTSALAAQLICTSNGISLLRRANAPAELIDGAVRATLALLQVPTA